MKLYEKLTALRKEKDLSQEELAEMMLVSRQAVSKWERGTAIPTTENLKYLSELYGVSLECLFGDAPLAPKYPETAGEKQKEKRRQTRLAMVKWLALALWALVVLAAIICAAVRSERKEGVIPISNMQKEKVNIEEIRESGFGFDVGW